MKSWYCIKTISQKEIEAESNLKAQGYKTYCPLKLTDKRKRRKTDTLTEPLFPRYMFISMEEGEDSFYPVSKTPGVARIIKLTEREIDGVIYLYPTQVPDYIIENLREIEDKCGIHVTKHDYQAGDRVRIKGGAFDNYEALIQATAQDRVIILLDIIGKLRPVKMAYHEVEPA